jgi:hypothetical protein
MTDIISLIDVSNISYRIVDIINDCIEIENLSPTTILVKKLRKT